MGVLVVIFIIGWILINLFRAMEGRTSAPMTRARRARQICPVCTTRSF
jgi:hypothetical protein